MFLVDYSIDYYGSKTETRVLYSESEIIDFVADKSEEKHFQVKRINKYEEGTLYPHELTINKGRIVVEKLPLLGGNK